MKKIFGLMLAAALAMPMFAETDAKADYSDWLPKAGDWNVVVGMNPLGIVMGGSWSNVGGFAAGYMVTDKMSVKASIGLDLMLWNNRGYARDDAKWFENPFSMAKVEDTRRDTRFGGTISVGAEWHVGETRKVQGVFGAGLMYGAKVERRNYTYGNGITQYNQVPTVTNELGRDGNPIMPGYVALEGSDILNARVLSQYNTAANPLQMVGVYGSAGIEWFVIPKMAIGMNASLNIMYQFMNAYTTKYEGWSSQQSKLVEWTDATRPMENGFSFKTSDLLGLTMFLSVYL